ncbi:hypothetical protein Nepgr_001708 [Nepenthes gracilis]|uniref:Uncharacterized protein n=1 Tax=Nepenthes gracilis TaxID=150966 RepID=A0AAD3RX74_NEPGR|nr:hypothetical protein Nepgr_001708 [Nepenthes gracilis]
MSNNGGCLGRCHNGCDKKRRRWPGEGRVFKFRSFGSHGCPVEFEGTFWNNVKALLEFGCFESNLVCSSEGVMLGCWSFQLELHRRRPDRAVFLFVVEEPVEASSIHRYCKHCQHIGESLVINPFRSVQNYNYCHHQHPRSTSIPPPNNYAAITTSHPTAACHPAITVTTVP